MTDPLAEGRGMGQQPFCVKDDTVSVPNDVVAVLGDKAVYCPNCLGWHHRFYHEGYVSYERTDDGGWTTKFYSAVADPVTNEQAEGDAQRALIPKSAR